MIKPLAATAMLACVAAHSNAQSRLDASVVSVSGTSVYISAGQRAGVATGARVVFILSNGQRIEGTIVDVSGSSARAQLHEGSLIPAINDRAEVDVPPPPAETPPAKPDEAPQPKPVPEHPPWTRQEGARSADQPLLAPAYATRPEDRPTSISGRVFANIRHTKDFENDLQYSYTRVGTWLEVKNPFKDGGRVLIAGDTDMRVSDTFRGNDTDLRARLQRFSYAWGNDQHAPYRVEAGRFYSYALPEIGLVDGIEAQARFENGWAFGAGAGLYPTPNNDANWGDDYGVHVFADYLSEGATKWMQGTIGFQQTIHKGETDRSLLIGRLNARPTDDLMLFGSILIDLYGPEDDAKDQFADITQLFAQASYQFNEKTGVNASLTRTTWPELKREEYVGLPFDLLRDGYVDRVAGSVWRKLHDNFRLSARAHYWQDQDREGNGGELSADWYETSPGTSSAYGSLYYEDSAYTTGVGGRIQGSRDFGPVRLFASYDAFSYTSSTLLGGSSQFLRHTVRADASWSTGHWSWDVDLSYYFGDSENALSLGLYLQYRF